MLPHWLAATVPVVALACAAEPAPPEPFAFLSLTVTGQLPASDDSLRVVIVWDDPGSPGGVATGDDGAAVIGAPLEFGIAVHPATRPDDTHGPIARGNAVAYLDRDGDGRFSWTDASSRRFRDLVVGWVPGYTIVYAPLPGESSPYPPGVSLVVSSSLDVLPQSRIVPLDTPLSLHAVAVEATACVGLTPPPRLLPSSVIAALRELEPLAGHYWPYRVGVPACPDNVLPADWWEIACRTDPGAYRVTVLEWPADPAIAELCGWSASYCEVTFAPGVEPPLEFPACDAF